MSFPLLVQWPVIWPRSATEAPSSLTHDSGITTHAVHLFPGNQAFIEGTQSRPLVIGLILDDGVVRVHPPIERAMREISTELEAKSHELMGHF
ncbi:hypothetical protein BJX70DRAFT_370539 [Aspergillus crustosus]